MAIKDSAQNLKRIEMIEKLWHRTKPDAGTTDAEKATARKKIEEVLASLLTAYEMNWKTGKVQPKSSSRQQPPKAEQPKAKASDTKAKADEKPKAKRSEGSWTTADLTAHLNKLFGKNWTPKDIRRILRSMEAYNDGVTTHYSWTGANDPAIAEIVNFIKGKKGKTA